MAQLSDLPAELVTRIILIVFHPKKRTKSEHHHQLNHNEITNKPKQLRPHLERLISPEPYGYRPYGCINTKRNTVSWPDGLPRNPLLPLSLVNRTFRRCAQEILFKNVALCSTWTASLFLRSLTSSPVLSRSVRSLQFAWGGPCSMGRGGGSVFCEILRNCPLLENIAIGSTFLLSCKEPVLEALASVRLVKEFVILHNLHDHGNFTTILEWRANEIVTRLFPHWERLETVDFFEVAGCLPVDSIPPPPASIPPVALKCAVRTIILTDHELDEAGLSMLLKSCGESLRTLKMTGPGYRLSRAALCRVLEGCISPNLESLTVESSHSWEQPISNNPDSHLDPQRSPGLLDIVFNSPTALRNLKSLSFKGAMATQNLFFRLPPSLIKLAWERCDLPATALRKALTSTDKDGERFLPNLKCCSVRTRYGWGMKDQREVETVLIKRGGCFHCDMNAEYGSPTMSDEIEEEERGYDEDPFDEIDHWVPPRVYWTGSRVAPNVYPS